VSTEEVFAALDPKLRKRLSLASEAPETQYQQMPSVGLTRALNGGLVYGRQVLIWGSKSSAKSSLCLQTIGLAQKEGKVCAWIDAEMSYDPAWAESLGVDSESLIYSTARTINDMVDVGTALMKAGVDLIVVDSISSLLPAVYFEKDSHDLKDLDQTKQIGAEARDMANAVKMLNYANNQVKPTLLILISQARNNINAMYTKQEPTGGLAVKYYSSTVIKLFSSESDAQAIKGRVAVGDKLLEEKIGRKVRWELQFSKTSPAMQGGEYDFYFRGDELGVDTAGELVDTADLLGVVERGGSWYTLPNGNRIQGRNALVAAVKEDQSLRDILLSKVNESW
jgi:recombination protein RecA